MRFGLVFNELLWFLLHFEIFVEFLMCYYTVYSAFVISFVLFIGVGFVPKMWYFLTDIIFITLIQFPFLHSKSTIFRYTNTIFRDIFHDWHNFIAFVLFRSVIFCCIFRWQTDTHQIHTITTHIITKHIFTSNPYPRQTHTVTKHTHTITPNTHPHHTHTITKHTPSPNTHPHHIHINTKNTHPPNPLKNQHLKLKIYKLGNAWF